MIFKKVKLEYLPNLGVWLVMLH